MSAKCRHLGLKVGNLATVLWAGAEGQNRTGDTSVFSAVLYRLSYLGSKLIIFMRRWLCQGDILTDCHPEESPTRGLGRGSHRETGRVNEAHPHPRPFGGAQGDISFPNCRPEESPTRDLGRGSPRDWASQRSASPRPRPFGGVQGDISFPDCHPEESPTRDLRRGSRREAGRVHEASPTQALRWGSGRHLTYAGSVNVSAAAGLPTRILVIASSSKPRWRMRGTMLARI